MKKFFVILGLAFVCITAFAHSVEWYVDDSLYQTTTCDSGDSITPPIAPEKYGYHFVEWTAGYTQLEYIESTGTQWIDTGFIANGGMILDAKVLPVNNEMMLGSIAPTAIDPNTTRNLISYTSNGVYNLQKLNVYTSTYADAGTSPAVIHFDTTGTNFYCTVNGNVVVDMITSGTLTNQTTTVKISFSDYNSTTRSGRYYYVKITAADGNVVRDFVPARRASDNTIGMYDTVTNTFFTNAGTGEFIAGPEVGNLQ